MWVLEIQTQIFMLAGRTSALPSLPNLLFFFLLGTEFRVSNMLRYTEQVLDRGPATMPLISIRPLQVSEPQGYKMSTRLNSA